MSRLARHLTATVLAAGCLLGTAATAGAATPTSAASSSSAAPSGSASAAVVCSVNAASLTIRNSPGGTPIGTLFQGYRFRIDIDDSVWPYGAGYDPNGNLVAYGYVLRQYLAC